jgi:hypothetical protein
MCLQFGFVIVWRKDFGAKAASKMLVKLTRGWCHYYETLFIQNDISLNLAPPMVSLARIGIDP